VGHWRAYLIVFHLSGGTVLHCVMFSVFRTIVLCVLPVFLIVSGGSF
jgi:hypothetical protein